MTAPTLSGLGHLAACPGSARFPRQEEERGSEARLGSAIHKLIECSHGGAAMPMPAALSLLHALSDDDAGRLEFVAKHMRLPVPACALSEVSLGYFPDGSVRRIEGGAGHYPDVGQWLSGQLDLVWSEPEPLGQVGECEESWPYCAPAETLWVVDIKTGEPENVPPPHANWQLRAGAVMAARWTGARRVKVAICFISPASISAALRAARAAREKAGGAAEMAGREATIDGDIPAGLAALDRMQEHLAAAEAHAREAAEGRWEIGETLDGVALDAIEVEMCAVLARARGEQDDDVRGEVEPGAGRDLRRSVPDPGRDPEQVRREMDREAGASEAVLDGGGGSGTRGAARLAQGREGEDRSPPPLILGAQCTHCHAAAQCPALSAFALTAARQSKADLETLDAATVAGLWAKVPALRRMADAIEVTARTWARKGGGALRLPDGREYGPAVEERRSYDTARTFDVLLGFVSEALANEGAVYTWASIERVLVEAGVPRARWGDVRKALEKAAAVVVTVAERWGYRQPAKPVEVDDGDERGSEEGGCAAEEGAHGVGGLAREPEADRVACGGNQGRWEQGAEQDQKRAVDVGKRDAGGDGGGDLGGLPADEGPGAPAQPVAARAPCPTCKREVRVNGDGSLRAHKPCSRRGLTDGAAPPIKGAERAPVDFGGQSLTTRLMSTS